MSSGNESQMATKDPPKSSEDSEDKISKAIRLWKHPVLRDIPLEQKRAFLHGKGVTDDQIHLAWDRIMNEDESVPPAAKPQPGPPMPPTTTPGNPYAAPSYPQPQQPYSDYSRPMYPPPMYDEEEGHGPFVQGASLVAVGGLLGLTAAAALRWLNGGEFQLLPPPSNNQPVESKHLILQEPQDDQGDDQVDDEPEEEEDEYLDEEPEELVPQVQEKMLEQVESLSKSFKDHVAVQEKILQKLTTQGSAVTNQSMDLLRNKGKVDVPPMERLQLWSQLVEIKAELRGLQASTSGNDKKAAWEDKLTSTLSRLDTCMSTLETTLSMRDTTVSTSPASPATESPTKSKPVASPLVPDPSTDASPVESTLVPPSKPPAKVDSSMHKLSLRQSVKKLAEENDAKTLKVGTQLLYLYIVNLSGNPANPRYRKIFTSSESFERVESLKGGKDLLLAVGFEEKSGCLEWLASDPSPEREGLFSLKLQQAASVLGMLKGAKPSRELTESVLAVVPPDPDVQLIVPPGPTPPPEDQEWVATTEPV